MVESIINPFVGCTARDMKYDEIRQYWCSPFELYHLNESELLLSRTPIVIEGIRGSGKTMILKYLSYSIQKEYVEGNTIEEKYSFFTKRSFGIYFRYKDDFCNLFTQLVCSTVEREKLFRNYFELFIVRELLEDIRDLYRNSSAVEMLETIEKVLEIPVNSFNDALEEINKRIIKLDDAINESDIEQDWYEKIASSLHNSNLLKNLIKAISMNVYGWHDTLFVILLDEYENLGVLQTIVNTLIKQVDDTINLTYRIGVRPAGMDKNNSTYVGDERLQVDRDYILRRLEYNDFSDYKRFAMEISNRRLENIDTYKQKGLTDISKLLGKRENFDWEAANIARGNKQFNQLFKKYPFPASEQERIIKLLSCNEKLLEMYNILLVYRGEMYTEVADTFNKYVECRKNKELKKAKGKIHTYDLGYGDKYRLTLLYLLLSLYGEKKLYYSFNTFLYLSSGSINDFISLCRNTFKLVDNDILEELSAGNTIPANLQTYGAIDTAEDQRRKVTQGSRHGNELYSFIDNMGGIFEEYHRDIEAKYPETNQFAFSDENQIRNDKELNEYLIELINSGAIIKKSNRQLKSPGKTRGNIYKLNRIFAPIYQFSYRTRGGINQMITPEQFREMLFKAIDPKKIIKNKKEYDYIDYNFFDNDAEGYEDDDYTEV